MSHLERKYLPPVLFPWFVFLFFLQTCLSPIVLLCLARARACAFSLSLHARAHARTHARTHERTHITVGTRVPSAPGGRGGGGRRAVRQPRANTRAQPPANRICTRAPPAPRQRAIRTHTILTVFPRDQPCAYVDTVDRVLLIHHYPLTLPCPGTPFHQA